MNDSTEREFPWGWLLVAVGLIWYFAEQGNSDLPEPTPVAPITSNYETDPGTSDPSYDPGYDYGYDSDPGYDSGYDSGDESDYGYEYDTGYENPAPGDDGSFDCAPGQGPVMVAPGDPNGLDGDGDGIGCE